jgi:hypothetical protein
MKRRRRARFPHPQFQPVPFQLEFREVMLPHQLENPFDISEIH